MEVLEFFDESGETIVKRLPEGSAEIKWGAQLTVQESQVAVFFRDGRALDVFGPGRHILKTQNLPLLTKLITSLGYGTKSPFRAHVCFVNMKLFRNMKWGTRQPITLRDTEFHLVRLRAFGMFSMRVSDPSLFVNKIVGSEGLFQTREIAGYLKSLVVSRFSDLIGELLTTVLDLPRYYDELGVGMKARLGDDFGAMGLELTDFIIESVSLPEEVQKRIDERSSMAALGDLGEYTRFKAAQAIQDAAQNPSGAGGAGMGVGVGVGFGAAMADMVRQTVAPPAAQQPAAPAAAAKPPEDPFETLKKLKQLLDLGAITQEEFDAKKKEILERL
jgi:membrane protease subunit (stomatin/prohibitin family)